jgi:hypothetical protein
LGYIISILTKPNSPQKQNLQKTMSLALFLTTLLVDRDEIVNITLQEDNAAGRFQLPTPVPRVSMQSRWESSPLPSKRHGKKCQDTPPKLALRSPVRRTSNDMNKDSFAAVQDVCHELTFSTTNMPTVPDDLDSSSSSL